MSASSCARAAWREARGFQDLCRLAADFLVGNLAWFPGWMAPDVDEETDPIVPVLCALCAAGILPLASQPGHARRREHDERLWSRRAFLTAFVAPETVTRLRRGASAGWVVRDFPATACGGAREPVGLVGGEPFLWAGDARGAQELELFAEDLAPSALADLGRTRYLSVHDRTWGRGAALFGELELALASPGSGREERNPAGPPA